MLYETFNSIKESFAGDFFTSGVRNEIIQKENALIYEDFS